MANIASAKKRAKQTEVKRLKNLNRKTAIKTAIKKVIEALASKAPQDQTLELLKSAESQMAKAKGKGVLHANTASRKISRLTKKVAETYNK
ncbi:MAG: 30S ribosomal protein S20 [candidate division TM6 bacterium GW2011_GWF2_30_66]|jgi:small subunit ribosomal protein S20|nr:MAG: 30S ribosomal protein S20 [candidate division TM6 bacterium GW2011_GWF2_30_66]